MERILSTCGNKRPPMLIAYCPARSPETCRFSSRPSIDSSSISRLPRHSASKSHPHCLRWPTRLSNEPAAVHGTARRSGWHLAQSPKCPDDTQGLSAWVAYPRAQGHVARLPALVAELVAAKVDAMLTLNYPGGLAAKEGTTTIPIVMTSCDPLATGLVDNLTKRNTNITGILATRPSAWNYSKRLSLEHARWRCCGTQLIWA